MINNYFYTNCDTFTFLYSSIDSSVQKASDEKSKSESRPNFKWSNTNAI